MCLPVIDAPLPDRAFRATYPSEPSAVPGARRALLRFAADFGFTHDELADIETAAGEALANAVEHGYRRGSSFTLEGRILKDGIEIEVRDQGRGFTPRPQPLRPASDSPRGFGIFLMQMLMDEVEYLEGGTRVRLRKRRQP